MYGLTICGTSAGDAGKKVYGIGDMSYDSGDPESVYAWQNRYPGYVIHVDLISHCINLYILECQIDRIGFSFRMYYHHIR